MRASRNAVNLVAVVAASAVLVLYAITQLVAQAVLENTYPLSIRLAESGGLLPDKEVTYRGIGIGVIGAVDVDGDGVRIQLDIDNGVRIPREVDVVVLRRSAVGEQALDLRPPRPLGPQTQYYEAGEEIIPASEPVLPTKPERLLTLANDVFGPVDEDNAATVVAELADAVRGRSDDVRSLMADSATFSEAVADNGANYDRLFAASRVTNAALAASRDALAQVITDLADGAELLRDLREETEALLATAPPVLDQTTDLLQRSQANLSCDLRYLADLNAFTALPDNLDNFAEALRVNRWFFVGYDAGSAPDPLGHRWTRVEFVLHPEPPPLSYLPDKRPIPDILPGGACESPFGPGAGAAVQANHTVAIPEAQVVPPDNNRPDPVRIPGGAVGAPAGLPPQASVGGVGAGGAVAQVPLPATGGGLLPTVAGVVFLGAAALLHRLRSRQSADWDADG